MANIKFKNFDPKSPAESELFSFDWSSRLDGRVITASDWAVSPAGPTLTEKTFDGKTTSVRVAGGSAGTDYTLSNTVTITTPADTLEGSVLLPVRSL